MTREADPSVFWTQRALSDLEEIADYIAQDDQDAARRWVNQLIAVAERAAQLPFAGRTVPEFARDDVREVLRRQYRIVYRVRPGRIEVLTVFDSHRQLRRDVVDGDEEH